MVLGPVRRHPIAAGSLLLGAAVGVGSASSSRLDPAEWHPPDPPAMTGALAPNRALAGRDRVLTADGPEDVAVDGEGRLYTGGEDGTVYRTTEPVDEGTTDAAIEVFARTEGRPLGLTFDGEGEELLVAVAGVGLVSVAPDGDVTTLTARAGGQAIVFADDIHVADDGTVYFTDATVHDQFQDELFELRDTGRLLAYDSEAGETTVELEGLGFANGVVPGPEGESLLINETSRYRITRYWTDGERAGEAEPFATNLVGYPDNIDVADDGDYWVAIPSLRDPTLDRLHHHPWLVRQLGRLPQSVLGQVSGDPYGLVLRMDADGEVVESLHDPTGNVFGITSATPHEGALYLGTLFGEHVVRYPLE
jgi:sugar lactone lactonase YvrE